MTRRFATLLVSALALIAATMPAPLRADQTKPAANAASGPASVAPADEAAPSPKAAADERTPDAVADDDQALAHDEAPVASSTLAPPDPAERTTLEARLKSLDDAGLSDEDKRRAVDYVKQALASFDAAAQQIQAAIKFEAELERTKTGNQSTAETSARVAAPLPVYKDASGTPLAEVEQLAENCEQTLAAYRAELAAMLAEPKRRSQRMADLPGQIADAKQKLKQATDDLAALGADDAGDPIAAARRAALTYAQLEAKATLDAFDREQRLYDETGEWVAVRRDFFARYVPHVEKRLADLREVITQLRASEAAERARLATAAAEVERSEVARDLADDNKTLADDGADVTEQMNEAIKDLDDTRAILTTLTEKFKQAQEQAGQLSTLGGQMLRDQQARLPDAPALRRDSARREALLADVLLHIFDLNDQSASLANIDDATDAVASRAPVFTDADRKEVEQLLATKRETLDRLIDDYGKYSTKLNELHNEEAKLIDVTESYASFIAERVLWIKSCSTPSRGDWRYVLRGFAWSVDPHHWYKATMAMVSGCGSHPFACCGYLFVLLLLAGAHAPARRRLSQLGEEARRRDCDRMAPTLQALVATVVISLPWPTLLTMLSWSLDPMSISEFVRSLGVALRMTAVCLLMLELARNVCRRGGLGDAHFNWPSTCLAQMRGKLHLLELVGAPLMIWFVALDVQGIEPRWSPALGRPLFIALMLLLAVTLERLLLASKSPFRQLVVIGRSGWLAPLQIIWRPLVTLLPLAAIALAIAGYYYTSLQASHRLLKSGSMVLAVLVLGGVTRRWLMISHRRLAREQARQRRALLAAADDTDAVGAPSPAELIDDSVDLAALSEQTQKLVHMFLTVTLAVGLVFIWSEILPALQYPAKQLLPGATTLTWGNLIAFLLILVVTYITVRDVPALLELVVLRRLPLDAGSRYAFAAVARYALATVGLVTAFHVVGGDWSKIQWLVAAMSLGLGFGLQEIFANFVSGIILLFERPIRVGDMVTLGDRTGVVSRIRMRATTIVDPDRKEYIVPNKDLVTERLLNWTLSDHTNRIEVAVNVANGTDTDLACTLLLEAAHEQTYILGEPAPIAMFESFSDNGLRLVLRCFLPNLENRTSTIHALHTAIDRKFRTAGIDGAFGDLRIRVAREAARGIQTAPTHVTFAANADVANRKADADRQGAA